MPELVQSTYPKKVKITLNLELELRDSEQESYILAAPSGAEESKNLTLQIGFLADLFDIFNNEANLGVEKINNFTHSQILRTLQAGV